MLSKPNTPPQSVIPAIIVSLTGTILVWYDDYLFGSLASIIAPHFFPKSLTELTGPAYAYTFVLALFIRPAGGVLFGLFADRRGRRSALALSLLLAGVSTFLIGILPPFSVLRISAPIALLALRTIQSLAFGGALVIAIVYVFELAPPSRRGFYTSLLQTAPALGLALSLASIVATRRVIGNKLLLAWGWRVPLVVSVLLVGLAIYLRLRMPESRTFGENTEAGVSHRRADGSRARMVKLLFGVVAAQVTLFFLSQFYAGFHLQNVLRIETWTASLIVCGANLLGIPFVILFGAMSDRFDRKKIIVGGCLLAALICLPVYSLMSRAAGVSINTIAPAIDPITGRFGPHSGTMAQDRFEPAGAAVKPNVLLLTTLTFVLVLLSAMVAGPLPAFLAENFSPESRGTFVAGAYVGHAVFGGLLPVISLPLLLSTGNIYTAVCVAALVALGAAIVGAVHRAPRVASRLAPCLLLVLLLPVSSKAIDQKRNVIYQIMVDRFVDGDPANNDPPQSPRQYDPAHKNWQQYWGGDLEGIRQKIPYLAGLGVTVIWISPPADNINKAVGRTASFHGYQARDFKRIEEHFGDASNSWTAFDALVTTAHEHGIKVIVDLAVNHSSIYITSEFGALYDNGLFLADFFHDPDNYFNHLGFVSDNSDAYETQYFSLYGLSDINQENPRMDEYLKSAARLFQQHGADGFRIDAIKHVTWGWMYTMANDLQTQSDSFVLGEWYLQNTYEPLQWDYVFANSVYSAGGLFGFPEPASAITDPLYHDAYKFMNNSGISLMNFPLNQAVRNVFGPTEASFAEIDSVLSQMSPVLADPNGLITFIDSQDSIRLLSLRDDRQRYNLALGFLLTAPGTPCIYYGAEQYLHNDTEGGKDPYNRPLMESFDTTTDAYSLIGQLSALRQRNPAIAYGSMAPRRVDQDVYVYERNFFGNVVLVAINKSSESSYTVSQLETALPLGRYDDYLHGKFGGASIQVANGKGQQLIERLTLPPHSISVWSYATKNSSPKIGSIYPRRAQPGVKLTIAGTDFGSNRGTVKFGDAVAAVDSWSDTQIQVTVPEVAGGRINIQVARKEGAATDDTSFMVLTAKSIPVVITVNNLPPLDSSDHLFITGDVSELGSWRATWDDSAGPMLTSDGQESFLCVGLPAETKVNFKFVVITDNGNVRWSSGNAYEYTVPLSGVGRVKVSWR
jgi:glycosidase/MFS family permease